MVPPVVSVSTSTTPEFIEGSSSRPLALTQHAAPRTRFTANVQHLALPVTTALSLPSPPTLIPQQPATSSQPPPDSKAVKRIEQLSTRLPLPKHLEQLTRSGALFARLTRVDPRSLSIREDAEHFLFVELREKHQWASFRMKPSDYVHATEIYNAELEKICRGSSRTFVKKNPRALLDKLGDFEDKVTRRLATQDFKCAYFITRCIATLSNIPISSEKHGQL